MKLRENAREIKEKKSAPSGRRETVKTGAKAPEAAPRKDRIHKGSKIGQNGKEKRRRFHLLWNQGKPGRRRLALKILLAAVLLIASLAPLLSSPLFLLYGGQGEQSGNLPMLLGEISLYAQEENERRIEDYIARCGKDVFTVYENAQEGDSFKVNNLRDVLCVYCVLVTEDTSLPAYALQNGDFQKEELKRIYSLMNTVSLTAEETEDTLLLTVSQKSLTALEGAEVLGFNEEQKSRLNEFMSPAYDGLFLSLMEGGEELPVMPSGTGRGQELVNAALSRVGCPYVMGAKGENRFDCSGLVYWSVSRVDPVLGQRMRTNAAGQARYCVNTARTVSRDDLKNGDLIFWQNKKCGGCGRFREIHHVGIYAGDGYVIEASSSRGRVVVRKLWSSASYPLVLTARLFA